MRGGVKGCAATVPSVMYSMVHADGMCVRTDVCGVCVQMCVVCAYACDEETENAKEVTEILEEGIHTVQV